MSGSSRKTSIPGNTKFWYLIPIILSFKWGVYDFNRGAPSPPRRGNLSSPPLKFFNVFYYWSRQRFYNYKFCFKQIFCPMLRYKDIGAQSSAKPTPCPIRQPILTKFQNLVKLDALWKYPKSGFKNFNPFLSYSPFNFNMALMVATLGVDDKKLKTSPFVYLTPITTQKSKETPMSSLWISRYRGLKFRTEILKRSKLSHV